MAIIISDTNQGPVVNIAAWFGTIVMVLGVATRIWSKYTVLRKWSTDDALIIITMFLGSAMTAAISMTVSNGLGKPQSSLSDQQIVEFQKYGYASQLLYIPALYLTKLTTLVYLRALLPESSFAVMSTSLVTLIIIWSVGAEFAIAFQCRLPSPWAILSAKCFNRIAFWTANGAFDILTDVAIVFLPLYLVWSLRMSWKRKGVVVMAFGSRVLVIPLTTWRIYSLGTINPRDQTLSLYYVYLTTTIQLNSAILMACVTFLRPFMEAMVSGGMTSTVLSTKTSSTKSSNPSSQSSRSARQAAKPKRSYGLDNLSEVRFSEYSGDFERSGSTINDSSIHVPSDPNDDIRSTVEVNDEEDVGSHRVDKVRSFSQVSSGTVGGTNALSTGSGEMIITQTREWNIQEEYRHSDG